MRFIGKIATLPVRRHIEEWDERSQSTRIVQQGIIAVFEQGLLTKHEVEEGLAHLGPFTGLPILEDDQVPVSPRKLLRVYDTDVRAEAEYWDKKTKAFVETYLQEHVLHGTEFLLVETPRVAAPWPAYPKLVAKTAKELPALVDKILATVEEQEYDPKLVLAYELENLNRPKVVAALQALLPAEPAEDLEAIAAANAAKAAAASADDLITA